MRLTPETGDEISSAFGDDLRAYFVLRSRLACLA